MENRDEISYEDLSEKAKGLIVLQIRSLQNDMVSNGELEPHKAKLLLEIAKFLNDMAMQEKDLAEEMGLEDLEKAVSEDKPKSPRKGIKKKEESTEPE